VSRLRKLLNPQTTDHQELRVPLPPERTLAECEEIADEFGWDRKRDPDDPGRLTITEDISRLTPDQSPVRLEVEVRQGSGGSAVDFRASVAGVGGLANNHLRDCVLAFVVVLGRRAKAA
jgi:hypothetical protein